MHLKVLVCHIAAPWEASCLLEKFDTTELQHGIYYPEEFLSNELGRFDDWNLMLRLATKCKELEFQEYCENLDISAEDFQMKHWCINGAKIDDLDTEFVALVCLRALALKLANLHLEMVQQHHLEPTDVADALAIACTSVAELQQTASKSDFPQAVKNVCEVLSQDRMKSTVDVVVGTLGPTGDCETTTADKKEVDVDTLDFGLFTSFPPAVALLQQSMPVVWLTLMAIWPLLLKRYLGGKCSAQTS